MSAVDAAEGLQLGAELPAERAREEAGGRDAPHLARPLRPRRVVPAVVRLLACTWIDALQAQLVAERVGARPVALAPGVLPRREEGAQRVCWARRLVGRARLTTTLAPGRFQRSLRTASRALVTAGDVAKVVVATSPSCAWRRSWPRVCPSPHPRAHNTGACQTRMDQVLKQGGPRCSSGSDRQARSWTAPPREQPQRRGHGRRRGRRRRSGLQRRRR